MIYTVLDIMKNIALVISKLDTFIDKNKYFFISISTNCVEPKLILKNVKEIYAGSNNSFAIQDGNTILGWGKNDCF